MASVLPGLRERALIGMVHVGALPGTPRGGAGVDELADRACDEAALLAEAGFDALIVENMHDTPYVNGVGPEVVSAMGVVVSAVRGAVSVPVGVQILSGSNEASVAVAHAAGGSFVRAENFVFASVADEGVMGEASAGPLLRYRRGIGAGGVRVFADIKKKHSSHALTADVDIAETARAAVFFGADGVIVTGVSTGRSVDEEELASVRAAVGVPVVVGSGATPEALAGLYRHADGVIVGSWYKKDGLWSNGPDSSRVREIVAAARG